MTGGTKAIAVGISVIMTLVGVIGCFQGKESVQAPVPNDKSVIGEKAAIDSTHQTAPASEQPTRQEQPITADDAAAVADVVPLSLDLTKHYAIHASNFDKTGRYPWKMVPQGAQAYANVPLKLDGAIFLWGEQNAKRGLTYPEKIAGIEVKRKFETLYVYHAAFFEGDEGTPVYDLVFQFQDGSFETNTIRCRDDIRDWYVSPNETVNGPSGPRSILAWSDEVLWNDRKHPLRFCLTAITNPHPEVEVTSIDLISSKTRTAGCIMAMTVGKSTLMLRTSEAE